VHKKLVPARDIQKTRDVQETPAPSLEQQDPEVLYQTPEMTMSALLSDTYSIKIYDAVAMLKVSDTFAPPSATRRLFSNLNLSGAVYSWVQNP